MVEAADALPKRWSATGLMGCAETRVKPVFALAVDDVFAFCELAVDLGAALATPLEKIVT